MDGNILDITSLMDVYIYTKGTGPKTHSIIINVHMHHTCVLGVVVSIGLAGVQVIVRYSEVCSRL